MSFDRYSIDASENLFAQLQESVRFEAFSKGRELAVLHRVSGSGSGSGDDPTNVKKKPLVRTTTAYQTPSQAFGSVHERVIEQIRRASGLADLELNNAMLEIYDARYTTMGFHTDQALDLAADSYICVFSCYELGTDAHPRVLTIKHKESGDEREVALLHHSVVVFSTATNQTHLHKIEAKALPKGHANRWMGFTLRCAKTFVQFRDDDDTPCLLTNGAEQGELTMATDDERKAFYAYKGRENREVDFEYPDIRYTISPSDRMPDIPREAEQPT